MTEKPKRRKPTPKGGRPPYRPTIEERQTVEEMKFCGESDRVISRALRIDPETLRKHFADELEDGHARRRKEVIGMLFKAARADNVTAIKRLEEMGRLAGAAEAIKDREAPAKPEKLGKKEEQHIAAQNVGGKFAPPSAPKLVVSNT